MALTLEGGAGTDGGVALTLEGGAGTDGGFALTREGGLVAAVVVP